MSKGIIIVFIIEFVALGALAMFERNPGMILYGIGGAVLNLGIFIMQG